MIGKRKKTRGKAKKQELISLANPSKWISSIVIPDSWTTLPHPETELRSCQVSRQDVQGVAPLVVSRSIVVTADSKWMVHINGHRVDQQNNLSLVEFPEILNADSTSVSLKLYY